MHLYEVGKTVRAGFKINLAEGRDPVIALVSKDSETGGPTCIALGNSICRELRHPEDTKQEFYLDRADYHETTAGFVLVAQTEEKSLRDERALVLIDRLWQPPRIKMPEIRGAREYTDPEHITFSEGIDGDEGVRRDLFLFRPGNGVFIRWDRRLIPNALEDLRFTLAWQKRMVRDALGQEKLVLGLWQDGFQRKTRRPSPRQPELRA